MARPYKKSSPPNFDESLLNFNKDLACLYHIQNLEQGVTTAYVDNQPDIRYKCLDEWASKIKPLFNMEEQKMLESIEKRVKSVVTNNRGKPAVIYNENVMKEFRDFLNIMMVKKGLHLNKALSMQDAVNF